MLRITGLTLILGPLLLSALALAPARNAADDELDEFLRFQARQTFENNCLICHAEEMTTRQRLTPTQWKTEVEKMIGWGAPVPPEEVDRLTAWLASEFSSAKPLPPAPIQPAAPLMALEHPILAQSPLQAVPVPERSPELFARHCATCHGADGRGADLGPNLVERPILLRPDDWSELVRDGRRRMPGFRAVLAPEEEADLLKWARALRPQP